MSGKNSTVPTMEGTDGGSGSACGSRRLTGIVNGSNIISNTCINMSKLKALRVSVDRDSDTISRLLLSSKETVKIKATIESAFRACREAFIEVSAALAHMMENRPMDYPTLDDIKKVVTDTLKENKIDALSLSERVSSESSVRNVQDPRLRFYASVADSGRSKIRVFGGPTVDVSSTSTFSSFLILPKEGNSNYESSLATKEALCKVFKPSDCGLKINRVFFTHKNGVKIDALSPNIDLVKAHPGLSRAGLRVVEHSKINPRLIIHNVPVEMTTEEIVDEIIAQNLEDVNEEDIKVVYLYPVRSGNSTTGCVLEVSPQIRNRLLSRGRVYLRFSACKFTDHVRVVQCSNCCNFGHLAKNCKMRPICGYCGDEHQMRDCDRKKTPRCGNCLRNKNFSTGNTNHAATDAKKCPILGRRITDKVSNTNYG